MLCSDAIIIGYSCRCNLDDYTPPPPMVCGMGWGGVGWGGVGWGGVGWGDEQNSACVVSITVHYSWHVSLRYHEKE